MKSSRVRHCGLTLSLILTVTSCTNLYTVNRRDLINSQRLLTKQSARTILMPAKTADNKDTYLRRSKIGTPMPLSEPRSQSVHVEVTNVRSPLIYTGLSIIAAGLVLMLAFGIKGEITAEKEDIDKYAGDGWLIGGACFSITALVGAPMALTGLFFDHPEDDAPSPAIWPSMQPSLSE